MKQLLVTKSMQIVVAFLDAFERRCRRVVLDDVVLDVGIFRVGENVLPVDDSAANFGHVRHFLVGAGGRAFGALGKDFHVFDVDHGEAARVFVEIFDRVLARDGNPAEVHFHFDEILVGGCQE